MPALFLNNLFPLVQVINALLHVLVFQVFFIGGVNAVEGPVRRQLDDPVTGGVEDLVVVGSHEDGALELNEAVVKCGNRFQVQVVGWLIQYQGVCLR